MKFHGAAEELLGSPAKVRLLRALLASPGRDATSSQLAREAGVSPQGALNILRQLEHHGLVDGLPVGPSIVWHVRKGHHLLKALSSLLGMGSRAEDEIRHRVLKAIPKDRVEEVVLFGSTARGEEKPDSDLDLLVIVKKPQDKALVLERICEVSVDLHHEFGNSVNPLVLPRSEVLKTPNRGLLRDIERDGITWWPQEGRKWHAH